jgi:hypothetical protein
VRKAKQPYHHPVPLSCNLGTSTSWNPLGHSRPVTGLLYHFYLCEQIGGEAVGDVGEVFSTHEIGEKYVKL